MTDRETAGRIYRLFRDLRRQFEAWAGCDPVPEIAEGNPDVAAYNRALNERLLDETSPGGPIPDEVLVNQIAAIIADGRA